MANMTRVRVELRETGKSGYYDKEKQFRAMHSAFKRAVNDEGIIPLWKQKQYHETKGEKRRRKRKEAMLNRRKEQSKLKYLGK